jgi:peptide chain release factor 1
MSLVERLAPRFVRLEARLSELEAILAASPDPSSLASLLRERGELAELVSRFADLREVDRALEHALREQSAARDEEWRALWGREIEDLRSHRPALEERLLEAFIRDEDDGHDGCILEVRAGTGGDEASLWAQDLLRMYLRFCERKGFRTEILDESRSQVHGVKEAIVEVTGPGAYGWLRYESGGHRVQRVPRTEAQGRIHTSAATVAVLPEVSEVQVQLKDQDLRIEAFRSSGPGGQSVNKTSSAIRVTHLPSGLVVSCQDEKSQHKNKARALKILRSRLYDLERSRAMQQRARTRRALIGSGDRSERIRTYNFPQDRVTDHRLDANFHDLEAILQGGLDPLLEALRAADREQRLQALADEAS